jgi:hypothetical protein
MPDELGKSTLIYWWKSGWKLLRAAFGQDPVRHKYVTEQAYTPKCDIH